MTVGSIDIEDENMNMEVDLELTLSIRKMTVSIYLGCSVTLRGRWSSAAE
jgi:hypothetical protein